LRVKVPRDAPKIRRKPLQGEEEGLLQRLGDPALEARRIGAVDQAVIVGDGQRQDQTRLEPIRAVDGLRGGAADAQQGYLRPGVVR
jgi:hypothetical protein